MATGRGMRVQDLRAMCSTDLPMPLLCDKCVQVGTDRTNPGGQGNLIPIEGVVAFTIDTLMVVFDPIGDIVKGVEGL